MKKRTYEEIKRYIESFGYELLSDEKDIVNEKGYVLTKTKLLIRCPKGHKYEVIFDSFQRGTRCRKCADKRRGEYRRLTYEEVKEYIESFGYKLLSTEYIKNDEPLLVQCNNGHQPYKVRFNNFKNGKRCPHCNDEHRHEYKKFSYEYVKEYIENFGYKLLSNEYNGVYEKLLLECPMGHRYYVAFNNFKNNNRRCPKCNISKGEQRIINWLNNNDFQYIPQKMFDNLLGVGNGLLSYDFYLPDYNLLIEYQGEFHNGIANYQTEEQLKIQQEHDRRKREYAKNNNIKLLEIWYWYFDKIEEILNKELKML